MKSPIILLCGLIPFAVLANGQAASARETPTVRLIRDMRDGVVAIFSQGKDGGSAGSGFFIHEMGIILSNHHVVQGRPGQVLLADGTVVPYNLVGWLQEKDLAVVQVPVRRPYTRIPLGRSHDLMFGEPVVAGGNPGARGIVFSSGIVSAASVLRDMNALVMTHFKDDVRDRFVQFDATSNRGNSGGALVNADGQVIGVVCAKNPAEESINFAIPADRVRLCLPELFAPEERQGTWLGIKLDPLANAAVIRAVGAGSPAAKAGLKPGVVILKLDDHPVRDLVDWLVWASLLRQPSARLTCQRGAEQIVVTLVPEPYPLVVPENTEGKKPGLRYQLYRLDHLRKLPDFVTLKPAASGIAMSLDPNPLAGAQADNYAIVYEGYVRLDDGGFQRLVISSDDGSRLYLDGRLVVDNDGAHPPQEASGPVRIKPGLHHLRIEFFDGIGDGGLKLLVRRPPDGRTEEIGEGRFFHNPAAAP